MAEAVQIYLVRHGLAAERGAAYPDDSKRPLTNAGMARLRQEARGLMAIGVSFDHILTSPLVRAKQTAEILAEMLPSAPEVETTMALAPGARPSNVIDELARHVRSGRIALVGHEPEMGQIAARLLGMRGAVPFKKGAVCCIDLDAIPPTGPGQLIWFATPKLLRKAAE